MKDKKKRDKKVDNLSLDEKLERAQFLYDDKKNKARRRRQRKKGSNKN